MKRMIKYAVFAALFCCAAAHAQPPNLVHYQGRLLDNAGDPVNGSVDMAVRLYTQETGGSQIWEQTLEDVAVSDGVYQFYFGDASFPDALTNAACWLELEVAGEVLGPRERQIAVPYALRAGEAKRLTAEYSAVPVGLITMWSGTLDSIPSGWALCDGSNGTPDLRSRFVAGAETSNEMGNVVGANSLVLSSNQLPAHTHSGLLTSGGAHTHSGSTASAGAHTHGGGGITSGGAHTHNLTYGGYGDTRGRPGGQYNTYATFNVSLNSVGNHTHTYTVASAGNHTHPVTINSAGDHSHTVSLSATGGSTAIDNRPAFYALAFIVKTP